jgi:cytochrome c oxidase assembly protein subunit 15
LDNSAAKAFKRHCLVTLAAVYFLILVGGIVRTTGSGMGCPDWPKCFGSWVPPTSVDQLPSTYKEDYSTFRKKKNVKFSKILRLVGMNEAADRLLTDESVLQETEFNSTKTWIEYINRLIGVVIGFLIILLVYKSFINRLNYPQEFWFSMMVLVVVLIQGWFGSIVVSTNLTSWTITVHMLLAFVLIAQLISIYSRIEASKMEVEALTVLLLVLSIFAVLVQVYLGTRVRELVDELVARLVPRNSWMEQIGFGFIVHRSFSWLVLAVHVVLFYRLSKTRVSKSLLLSLILLILASILTGVGMAYGGVHPLLQPIHLLLATLVFGVQLFLLFGMKIKEVNTSKR